MNNPKKTNQKKDLNDYIKKSLKFWRKCLKRAQKYWCMGVDELDAIQNGEAEYYEEEED